MKIFKNYQSKTKLRDRISELEYSRFELLVECHDLKKRFNKLLKNNAKISSDLVNKQIELDDLNESLKDIKRKKNSSKGGFIAKINELKLLLKQKDQQIEDLEIKLKESMSDKYLVKKIPSGRPPRQNKMKIKNCSKTSSITKYMHPQNSEEKV